MLRGKKILNVLKFDTYGWIAVSSLLICSVSGIFIAIPYDVNHPYESISLMLLDNPAASLIRNLHFWSAQAFLVFTVIHIFDHFPRKTEYNLSFGVWSRLVISILAVVFVMLSGFLLKGDPDAAQARRILSALIGGLPLIGVHLEYSLLGPVDSLQLIYVHHIATASIFIFIVLYEHVKSLWPQLYKFLIVTFLLVIVSFFFRAPLHDGFNPIVKGPWYFVGLQEILHWMGNPSGIWWILLVYLVLLLIVRVTHNLFNVLLKKVLLGSAMIYLGLTLVGYFFRGENWAWASPFTNPDLRQSIISPSMTGLITFENSIIDRKDPVSIFGRKEGCLACHSEMKGFSAAHDPLSIGCVSCHSGDPFTLNQDQAHRGMLLVPGNLADARRSCGTAGCHPVITERIDRSIMTTLSGMVSVDRYVFGESDSLSVLSHIRDIGNSPADQHLRDMCAHCHIGNTKENPGPVSELSRGGGCNACHINYDEMALVDLDKYFIKEELQEPEFHPSLSINVTDRHCFGCHSRSGRIALSYEGWHETLLEPADAAGAEGYRILDDQRVMRFVKADVHHSSGMECIDCHISFGLMGDGNLYRHKEEQVKIACGDCHYSGDPDMTGFASLDYEATKIARLRGYDEGTVFLRSKKSGLALVNTTVINGQPYLRSKGRGDLMPLRQPAGECSGTPAHSSLDCNSCHSAWVPQCIGCHNIWDPEINGYDLLDGKEKDGSWVEFVGQYFADLPVLGIMDEMDGTRVIGTFTPGMILTIDKTGFPGQPSGGKELFHRLYAPISAHTTSATGRSCLSCHLDPLALGYGRGKLLYDADGGNGKFTFRPRFASIEADGLPADAWTGFLKNKPGVNSTRPGLRPFNIEEQRRILTVGACLTCHPEESPIMQRSLQEFEIVLSEISDSCVVPVWSHLN